MTALIKGPRGFGPSRSLSDSLVGFVVGYGVIVTVAALMRPDEVLAFRWPTVLPLLFLAPLAGVAVIGLEYLVGILVLFVRTGKLVTRATIHSSYSAFPRIDTRDMLAILALVVGEELVLRQFLYTLLARDLSLVVGLTIVLGGVAYALNHLSFGAASAVAKLPTGLFYVWLFYVSGLSVLVVIVAHATQNLTLLGLSRARRWPVGPREWLARARVATPRKRSQEVGKPGWR